MSRTRPHFLTPLPAACLLTLAFLLTGCAREDSKKALADAADAINAAIEKDLSLDSYEFTVNHGSYLNDTRYEGQVTTYICVSESGGRNYYMTTTPDSSSTLTIEHKLIGDSHYHRIFDLKKGEYLTSSELASQEADQTSPPKNGWMLESSGDQSVNDDYKNRLWIYSHRISPEDFTEISRKKEDNKTIITLRRSTDQDGYLPLHVKVFRDEGIEWYTKELAREDLPQAERNSLESKLQEIESMAAKDVTYTAETLEAVIDSDGLLTSIEYKLTYDSDAGTTPEGEKIESITQYNYVNLERYNDSSITIP